MSAIDIVQIIFQSVAILFMLTFIFIGIWSFIIFIKMYRNQRINNFLLEKISHSILEFNLSSNSDSNSDIYNLENEPNLEEVMHDDDNISTLD